MNLPRISALDLRSLEVRVREHNAKGGLQLRVWDRGSFWLATKGHYPPIKWSDQDVNDWSPRGGSF